MAPRPSPPDQKELEKRFTKVLNSMDLPPDKAKLLKSYDDNRKWEIILDQEKVTAKQPPEFYLKHLRQHLDLAGPKIPKTFDGNVREAPSFARFRASFRLKKSNSDMTSTQVLRDLEISLRTNNIHWVRDFLSEQHNGLDVLVSYLSYALSVMRSEVMSSSLEHDSAHSSTLPSAIPSRSSFLGISASSVMRKMKQSHSKLGLADAVDDIHVGVQCLRAIMNHQHGFNLVFQHKQAINCLTLSLSHKSLRTKTLVLELLAAVCLVSGGHEIIFNAFDNFKEVCGEKRRFETLMRHFLHYEEFHIDFMVACMQFINIAVHSVEDINYRVHLQFEFTLLGLDEYLTTLSSSESDRLLIQVNAYLDNRIDVKVLLEDSDTKNLALDHAAELEAEMSFLKEDVLKKENDWLSKIVDLEKQLDESRSAMEIFKETKESELTLLKEKILSTNGLKEEDLNICLTPPTPPMPPPPPQPPVVPMPPPPPCAAMGPPPPPPLFPSSGSQMSVICIKKIPQPRHRLPVLNWAAMQPNQVKGTVFAELDDEKLYKVIDFHKFEEVFKLGNLALVYDETDGTPKSERRFSRKPEALSLLEPNRLRNVAITKRKIELPNESVMTAIQNLDLNTLSLERVEALLRVLPNDQEVKAFREYENDKRPIELLSEEDRFLILLTKVERLSQRLKIMSYLGNFMDSRQHLQPQINAVMAASMSIKNSQKIKKVLEIVLAVGNYMNSSKRGPAYGFKLQSFDAIIDTKSTTDERRQTLMHFIALTIKEKFPDLANFDLELQCVEKASAVSLENVMVDINELQKGMQLVVKENDGWKDKESPTVTVLRDFLSHATDQLKKLKDDSIAAQEQYTSVVVYFGESPKTTTPSTFFSLFVRFAKSYRQAINDLESWKKQESVQQTTFKDKIRIRQNGNQGNVASELKKKHKQVKEKRVISREEVYHGALEDILLDLKNEPYRRADGMRRCNRVKANQVEARS